VFGLVVGGRLRGETAWSQGWMFEHILQGGAKSKRPRLPCQQSHGIVGNMLAGVIERYLVRLNKGWALLGTGVDWLYCNVIIVD